MLIHVLHQTAYRYAPPTRGAIQRLRLTPRDHEGQHVRFWRIDVEPAAKLRETEDCLGNLEHMFSLAGPLEALTISVEGEADVSDTAGVVRGSSEPFPPALYLRDTPLTAASDDLKKFATGRRADVDQLALLHKLMADISDRMEFVIGGTDATTTAADSFALGRGVCQDFAHIFITACRSCGIPARYVSGYLSRSDGVIAQTAGHAWTEAYVEDLGWVGFDPANGVSPTAAYVRVAVGLDYLGAAPVLGARHGGGIEMLEVRVAVQPVHQSQS